MPAPTPRNMEAIVIALGDTPNRESNGPVEGEVDVFFCVHRLQRAAVFFLEFTEHQRGEAVDEVAEI